MGNPFLSFGTKDIATAKLYENAVIVDLEKLFGTNAPALTEGTKIYINTEDNLFKTLPNYNIGMLKWLLWHEQQHLNLKHHNRFFRYLHELDEAKMLDEFQLTKEEVNIIMDILVHDSLCKWFPDLIEIAQSNYAQIRNCNSLKYTFTTFTLEEMLDEYKAHKSKSASKSDSGKGKESKDGDEQKEPDDTKSDKSKGKSDKKTDKKEDMGETKMRKDESKGGRKGHKSGGKGSKDKKEEDLAPEEGMKSSKPEEMTEHDKVDWDKAKEIDDKEFITEQEAYEIQHAVEKLKRQKLKLARITETLNGLATDQRMRTYAVPSRYQVGKGVILKGRKPGKAKLYLIFDASGSMYIDMDMFKEIIKKSIPQALEAPCEWFSGYVPSEIERKLAYTKDYHDRNYDDYYKGKFKDFMRVEAQEGYNDDGDRVLDLCLLAEEQGFNPIGVTDGGGCIRYLEVVKKLKRTVLVGDSKEWLRRIKEINPAIQTIYTGD